MALVIDPDNLSQGLVTAVSNAIFATGTGADIRIHSGAANLLPALAAGEMFEVRDHSNPVNNGLYVVVTVSTSTDDYECDKLTGSVPATAAGEAITTLGATGAANEKSVHVDTAARAVYVIEQGNVSVDGVLHQALYSFLKEEWKDDSTLIPYPFPMTAITPEQFEYLDTWNLEESVTPLIRSRKLVRTGGFSELDLNGNILRTYPSIISLGTFEDSINDLAYYVAGDDPTDTGAATDFDFAGPLNEAVLLREENFDAFANTLVFANSSPDTITRTSGSWITDGYRVGGQVVVRNANTPANNGTYYIGAVTALVLTVYANSALADAGITADAADTQALLSYDNRNAFAVYLRIRDGDPNGKTFSKSDLAGIGVTLLGNQAYRFPLSNATDLKISETDANIASLTPYTEILVHYFDQAYARDVDTTGVPRNFGIVVAVGTHPGVDGSTTASGSTLTSLEGGIVGADYTGGTLVVTEGANAGIYSISGTPSATVVTITTTFPSTASNQSFYLQRAAPVVATAEEIYEKVQYLLRQAADVDASTGVVTGKTADEILRFVGETMEAGQATPGNPNGGGSGVFIEGFDSNDTNRLTFYDNTAISRTFPFVAAGLINFNPNLVNDGGPAKYWMFFEVTHQVTVADMALSLASGATASLDSAGANLPALSLNDYVLLSGFTDPNNNGVWRVTDAAPTTSQADVEKYTGEAVSNETGASRTLGFNPVDSPAALLVQNNSSVSITGTIGASSVGFDFDYDGNVQGGRTAGQDANIRLRAMGLDTAVPVETTGVITRNTGLSYSLVAGLERNYSNP